MTHVGSGVAAEVDAALRILSQLVQNHTETMATFDILLKVSIAVLSAVGVHFRTHPKSPSKVWTALTLLMVSVNELLNSAVNYLSACVSGRARLPGQPDGGADAASVRDAGAARVQGPGGGDAHAGRAQHPHPQTALQQGHQVRRLCCSSCCEASRAVSTRSNMQNIRRLLDRRGGGSIIMTSDWTRMRTFFERKQKNCPGQSLHSEWTRHDNSHFGLTPPRNCKSTYTAEFVSNCVNPSAV